MVDLRQMPAESIRYKNDSRLRRQLFVVPDSFQHPSLENGLDSGQGIFSNRHLTQASHSKATVGQVCSLSLVPPCRTRQAMPPVTVYLYDGGSERQEKVYSPHPYGEVLAQDSTTWPCYGIFYGPGGDSAGRCTDAAIAKR